MVLAISGRVFTGMGKGRYYVGHPEYQSRFLEGLGYRPYPGTLNIKLEEGESVRNLEALRRTKGIHVEGFRVGDESFSSLNCFPGRVGAEVATLLVVDVTYYNDRVGELISPVYLRGKFGLRDGDITTFRADPPR